MECVMIHAAADITSNWLVIKSEIMKRKNEAANEASKWDGIDKRLHNKYQRVYKKYHEIGGLFNSKSHASKIHMSLKELYGMMYD